MDHEEIFLIIPDYSSICKTELWHCIVTCAHVTLPPLLAWTLPMLNPGSFHIVDYCIRNKSIVHEVAPWFPGSVNVSFAFPHREILSSTSNVAMGEDLSQPATRRCRPLAFLELEPEVLVHRRYLRGME